MMTIESTHDPSSASRRRRPTVAPVLALLLGGLLVAGACGDSPAGPDELARGEGSVEIRASVRSPNVSTLAVEVTAEDIPDPLLFNLELVGTDTDGDGEEDEFTASRVLTVPAGGNRLFQVRAFDDEGIRTHEGGATMHVTPGPNASAVVVRLNPLTGDLPIDIVLGSFEVTITPETTTIGVRGTQQFTAEVTDENGTVDGAEVEWASSNPGVASIDGSGLVTGEADGTARIVATWMGVGAESEITITEVRDPSTYLGTYAMSPELQMTCPAPVALGGSITLTLNSMHILEATLDHLELSFDLQHATGVTIASTPMRIALDPVQQSFSVAAEELTFGFSVNTYNVSGQGNVTFTGQFADADVSGPVQIDAALLFESNGVTVSEGACTSIATVVTGTRISD